MLNIINTKKHNYFFKLQIIYILKKLVFNLNLFCFKTFCSPVLRFVLFLGFSILTNILFQNFTLCRPLDVIDRLPDRHTYLDPFLFGYDGYTNESFVSVYKCINKPNCFALKYHCVEDFTESPSVFYRTVRKACKEFIIDSSNVKYHGLTFKCANPIGMARSLGSYYDSEVYQSIKDIEWDFSKKNTIVVSHKINGAKNFHQFNTDTRNR